MLEDSSKVPANWLGLSAPLPSQRTCRTHQCCCPQGHWINIVAMGLYTCVRPAQETQQAVSGPCGAHSIATSTASAVTHPHHHYEGRVQHNLYPHLQSTERLYPATAKRHRKSCTHWFAPARGSIRQVEFRVTVCLPKHESLNPEQHPASASLEHCRACHFTRVE